MLDASFERDPKENRFVDVARIHFYPPLRGTEANKKIACSSDFISKGTETSLTVVI